MKFHFTSLALLVVATASAKSPALLRGGGGRGLQFDDGDWSNFLGGFFDPSTLDLDAILDAFLPALTELLESILTPELERQLIAANFTQELADVELIPGCTGDAAISYLLGELRGLDDFVIDSVALVPGTGSLNLSLWNGASWSAVWDVVLNFTESIGIDTVTTVQADACGQLLNATAMGSLWAEGAGISFQLGMNGSSPSIFDAADSFAESLQIGNATFTFDSLVDQFFTEEQQQQWQAGGGDFWSGIMDAQGDGNWTNIYEQLFSGQVTDQLLPTLQERLTSAFDGGLQLGK